MTTCKHCGATLVTDITGRCRACKQKASFLREVRGRSTLTEWGAQRAREKDARKHADRSDRLEAWLDKKQKPKANPYLLAGMTWQEAEVFACTWMRKNGYKDARVTPPGVDGGVDVISKKGVAQVKHHARPVGIAEVQRLAGIASAQGRQSLLFSATGVTAAALAWAKRHNVACYQYPPVKRL